MAKQISASVLKVQDALRSLGLSGEVVIFPDSTRTANEAAQAVGCQIGQIVKSLVFRGKVSRKAMLVEASGANRVNEQRLSELAGEQIEKADADFVRQVTGFAVGGVPPVAHVEEIETYIDEDLLQYEEIWAAAGSPYAVFRLTPEQLKSMTGGEVVSIK